MAQIIPFPMRPGHEPWVSKKDLAAHLGCSPRWIELLHHEGMPRRMHGSRSKYQIGAVEAWLEQRDQQRAKDRAARARRRSGGEAA